MRIDVTCSGVGPSDTLRGKVVRRVLLALSRFGQRVRRVTVRLGERPNPLGGVDQRCRVSAWLQGSDRVDAEAIDGTVESCVARAAAQLAQRVAAAVAGDAPLRVAAARGAALTPGRRTRTK